MCSSGNVRHAAARVREASRLLVQGPPVRRHTRPGALGSRRCTGAPFAIQAARTSRTPGTDVGKATDCANTGQHRPSGTERCPPVQPGQVIGSTCGVSLIHAANVSVRLANHARRIDAVHRFPIIQIAQ